MRLCELDFKNAILANMGTEKISMKESGLLITSEKKLSSNRGETKNILQSLPKTNIIRVFKKVVNELFEKNKNGMWSKLFLDTTLDINKKPINIGAFNKFTWDIGFILKLRNNKKLYDNFLTLLTTIPKKISYSKFKEVSEIVFNNKYWNDDLLNIIYFCHTLKIIDLEIKNGNIINIVSKIYNKDRSNIINKINRYFEYIIISPEYF